MSINKTGYAGLTRLRRVSPAFDMAVLSTVMGFAIIASTIYPGVPSAVVGAIVGAFIGVKNFKGDTSAD
jgi:predicted exporter